MHLATHVAKIWSSFYTWECGDNKPSGEALAVCEVYAFGCTNQQVNIRSSTCTSTALEFFMQNQDIG